MIESTREAQAVERSDLAEKGQVRLLRKSSGGISRGPFHAPFSNLLLFDIFPKSVDLIFTFTGKTLVKFKTFYNITKYLQYYKINIIINKILL